MSTSKFLYGIHDPGGEHILGGRGWVVFTELVSEGGKDYRRYADQGLGVIVRLNHSYGNGTLPPPSQYAQYAQDVANLARNSRGCKIWIIGNEPNHHQEGAIAFDDYTDGFNQAANAIRRVQPDAIVCIAAVAPWNMDAGDWLFYFAQLVRLCNCDGITLHTYTHGVDPALVYSDEKMQSHPDRYYHFKAYRDFMSAIPGNKRHLPVYITETDQDVPWANVNSGWVRNAYAEINWWNEQPGNQQIRALVLYRWPNFDKWGFCDLAGVHDDLRAAVALGYQWREAQPQVLPAPADWHGYVTASPFLRLRAGPNTTSNVLAEIDTAEKVVVIGEQPDWLQVNYGGLGGWVSAKWVSRAKPTINNESTQDQRSDWQKAIDFVLRWEGGFSADKNDPGNYTGGKVGVGEFKGTKFGISAGSYPTVDIVNLTKEQAIAIYERDYWQRSGADKLPWPLNLVVFDSAVNAGVGKAQQWLQQSESSAYRYLALRLEFYTKIDGWRLYGAAWSRRVADLMKECGK